MGFGVTARDAAAWGHLADWAQQGLTHHFQSRVFGARWLHNTAPPRLGQIATFNYWWLAHAVEVRVDGAARRGGGSGGGAGAGGGRQGAGTGTGAGAAGSGAIAAAARVALAQNTYAGILCRNRGLFNHYFDDMGWLALAALRLFDLTGAPRYLADAEALWAHIHAHGGSSARPGAIAWRDSQLDYLNAPTNGAFAILSARLAARTGILRYEAAADSSLAFFTDVLVGGQSRALAEGRPAGTADLVADGLNRLGDGTLDAEWLFSYNQGLYLGALVEAFDRTAHAELLERAVRTATATIARLAPTGRFLDEPARLDQRGGGDAGLFKGVFVRYLELLLERLAPGSSGLRMLEPFFLANTDLVAAPARAATPALALDTPGATPATAPLGLAAHPYPLVADDWAAAPGATTALSTQLAAVMAVEARARYERHRAAR